MFYRSVSIKSRYDKADEIKSMIDMVEALQSDSIFVESLFCDSKAGANYTIRLVTGDQADADRIAAKLDTFLVDSFGGHNGIYLSGPGRVDCHAPPNYRDEPSDFAASEATRKLFPTLAKQWETVAFAQAEEFISAGQSPREATSIVAHMLVENAWIVAGCGAASDGDEPDKDRFRALVEAALSRITFKPKPVLEAGA